MTPDQKWFAGGKTVMNFQKIQSSSHSANSYGAGEFPWQSDQHVDIIVSEFKFQLHYYIHFLIDTLGESMEPLIHPSSRLNNTVLLQGWL